MTDDSRYKYQRLWIDRNLTLEKKEWLLKCHSVPLISLHNFLQKVYDEVKEHGNVNLLWKRLPEQYQKETQDYDLNSMFEFLGKLIAIELKSLDDEDGEPGYSDVDRIQENTFNYLYEIIENGIIPGDSSKVTNYEEILKKYINHVGFCEGTAFINNCYFDRSKIFTKDEIAYLKSISR